MAKKIFTAAVLALALVSCTNPDEIHVITTGDTHGAWFDRSYVDNETVSTSLMSVMHYVDSVRNAVGRRNVILLDAGDFLQGDNAPFYYNYVRTDVQHLYSRIVSYMGYDAVVAGNHDFETGHPVYERVAADFRKEGIPFLAANAVSMETGEPLFQEYTVLHKGGRKVLVLGLTNANMREWLSESAISGIDFLSLEDCAQQLVDKAVEAEHPDVVIVLTHTATGEGNGSELESEGLDLLKTLKGVDLIVAAHDHRTTVVEKNGTVLVNSGSKAGYVTHTVIYRGETRNITRGRVVRLDKNSVDARMEARFARYFDEVRGFTLRPVGTLTEDIYTREAFRGMSPYINLVHTVQLSAPEAEISVAAPLSYNQHIRKGELLYNDMFSIYPYENQLIILRMTGGELRRFLEYSYNRWIDTPGEHILEISNNPDPRTHSARWSFNNRSYNFDSAAGINYTVDVTRPYGERVKISSLADGRGFDEDAWYNVAMTNYRANGGGNTIIDGAGISRNDVEDRTVARYPEIRDMVYRYIQEHGTISPETVSDKAVLGEWKFIPEELAGPLMDKDMKLLFN